MSDSDTLLVVYDRGSLAPTRIARAAEANDVELVFLVGAQTLAGGARDRQAEAHTELMMPTLRMLGETIDATGAGEDELLSLVGAHRPAGIVTFSEFQLESTARLADRIGLPHHRLADLPGITRKDVQRRRFAERGVDAVRVATITDVGQVDAAVGHVGLPAVVKPVRGASSRNTVAVHTPAEAYAFVAGALAGDGPGPRESALMLEELLVGRAAPAPWGDYIAVDCAVSAGRAEAMFVTSKFALAEPFRERGGYGGRSFVEDSLVAEVEALACRAVEAVGVTTGIADVEIKLTAAGPRVIEVNGRLGAWVDDLAVRSGFADPADVAVRAALGRPFEARRRPAPESPIAFHYLLVPPVEAGRVRGIQGVSALRRMPHVERVTVLTAPGEPADWRLGAAANAAAVTGTTGSHTDLADTVAALEEVQWITYD
ncbi:hypothetical protein ABT336_02735 [Micromonospora sp. NPDC000207]|uniref:ATP-grasp domain-containing protein n=1 Tax=Micromonospora sp. NPDC000207 TaxID=3154246 RepID=UPI003332F9AC